VLRSFVVGEDEGAWLALNARVFADHPEQGRWSAQDLALREREAWFDSAGFLLAWRGDALVGFHWTKTHGDGGHGHAPLGEIYVLGVAPEEAGRGLGHALSVAGLEYLRGRGLSEAMLFVDAENAGAVALYRSLGFRHWSTGVEYRAR
jgi:mycothiol synthase